MTTISSFSYQNDACLRALNVALQEKISYSFSSQNLKVPVVVNNSIVKISREILEKCFCSQEKCESEKLSPTILRRRSATVDTVAHSAHTQPVTPLKESSSHKEDEVLTSTPHKHAKQVPPLQAGEGSPSHLSKKPSGSTSSPPSTPTKTPQGHHRRLSRHNSYGYRQVWFSTRLGNWILKRKRGSQYMFMYLFNTG